MPKQMSQKRADQKVAKELKKERTKANTEQSKKIEETQRPAYYDQEGGSMCNGLGRSYF